MLQNNGTQELTILNGDAELTRKISVARLPEYISMRSTSSVVWFSSQTDLNPSTHAD
ncbi:hypothetical protein MCOR25_007440 [Pyricularia grisea]|nr:hypothetical protein MCOR25_007440 [Pyricularia grisea]